MSRNMVELRNNEEEERTHCLPQQHLHQQQQQPYSSPEQPHSLSEQNADDHEDHGDEESEIESFRWRRRSFTLDTSYVYRDRCIRRGGADATRTRRLPTVRYSNGNVRFYMLQREGRVVDQRTRGREVNGNHGRRMPSR